MEKTFTQLCVWQGTPLGDTTPEQFEEQMKEMFGCEFKFDSIQKTLPNTDGAGDIVPETGDREDLFFYVEDGYPMTFPIKRLSYGIRWWEDVLGNGNGHLYSKEFLESHPKTW